MIHLLEANVRSRLRSDVAISSVVQCVEELVLNSIDASASCVNVRVDLSCGKVQVIDNGCGIAMQQMEMVAERYWKPPNNLLPINLFFYRYCNK